MTTLYKGIPGEDETKSDILKDKRLSLTKPLNKSSNFGGKEDIYCCISNQ